MTRMMIYTPNSANKCYITNNDRFIIVSELAVPRLMARYNLIESRYVCSRIFLY